MRFEIMVATALAVGAAPATAQVTVIRAARMVDVTAGRLVEHPEIVIEKGRITSVTGPIPSGAQVIDLGDLTLLPGFIDAHVHLSFEISGDWVLQGLRDGPADAAFRAAANAKKTLLAGFTTVRDVGAPDFVNVALGRAVEAGLVDGPTVIASGHSIGITGGHCDATGFRPGLLEPREEDGVADGPESLLRSVRYQIKHGAKVIKICATAGVLSFEGPVGAQQMSEEEIRTVVEEAKRHGLKVAAHAHGLDGIKAAIRAGVTSIEHGSILDDEAIQMMKARGTYLVPTTGLTDRINLDALPPPIRAKAVEIIPKAKESIRMAIAAGVKIALGTDAAVIPHGTNGIEFGAMVARGMSPADAIRAGTLNGADLLGLPDRGVIAVGKRADLVAVRGNPLVDVKVLEDAKFVMAGGKVYKR